MSVPTSNGDLINATSRTPASAYLRVVPHGISEDGKLKLTVLFTPDAAAGGPFALETWPNDVMGQMTPGTNGGVQIEMRQVGLVQRVCDLVPSHEGHDWSEAPGVSVPALERIPPNTRSALVNIWQEAINQDALGPVWQDLAALIAQTLRGGHTQPADALIDTPPDLPNDDKHYGPDGQLLPEGEREDGGDPDAMRQVAAVMDIPHADLALSLEALRVEELCDSLWAARDAVDATAEDRAQSRAGITPEDDPKTAENDQVAYRELLQEVVAAPPENGVDAVFGVAEPHYQRLLELQQMSYLVADLPSFSAEQRTINRNIHRAMLDRLENRSKPRIRQMRIERREALSKKDTLKNNRSAAMRAFEREKACLAQQGPEDSAPAEAADLSPLDPAGAAQTESRENVFGAAADAYEYGTYAEYTATSPRSAQERAEAKADQETRLAKAAKVFFALQSNPALSRVFGLAYDVALPTAELWPDAAQTPEGFYYLRARLPGGQGSGPWTLCKVSRDKQGRPTMWPATEEEAHVSCVAHDTMRGAPPQFEGFLPLSCAGTGDEANPVRKFDLTSIDIRNATEMEVQRRQTLRHLQARVNAQSDADRDADADAVAEANADVDIGAVFQTAGLTLVNRAARTEAAQRLARVALKDERGENCEDGRALPDDVVLDAVDLTVGQRLYAGVPDAAWATQWHNLMLRDISYAETGHADGQAVIRALNALVGGYQTRSRRQLDAALLSTAGRLLPIPSEGGDGAPRRFEAVVEQAHSVWDGGPKGVACGPLVSVADALPIGRDHYAPTEETGASSGEMPVPLRYGQGYRVALAAVYSGGHSRPIETLPDPEGLDPDAHHLRCQVPYPALPEGPGTQGVKPYFRFLRQTKLAAPQVVLPEGHADRTQITTRYSEYFASAEGVCGPMGYDAGRQMVVRSMRTEDGRAYRKDEIETRRLAARATPALSQRIVIPPTVSFDEATRHGVFDDTSAAKPNGAFAECDLATDAENLPVTLLSSQTGADGRRFASGRSRTLRPDADANAGETGDGIFIRGGDGKSRHYSDPAADAVGIAIRLKGQATYLEGGFCIPLLGNRYPDVEPIVVTVERSLTPRAEPVEYAWQLLATPTETPEFPLRHFDPSSRGDIMAGNGHPHVRELRLRLAPGEAIEIDMWCVPSAGRLAKEFALVESFAGVLSQREAPNEPGSSEALMAAAAACLPAEDAEDLRVLLAEQSGTDIAFVGPGGVVTAPSTAIRAVAEFLHGRLKTRPLPELAAPVTLEAVHATNRAPQRPVLHGSTLATPFLAPSLEIADLHSDTETGPRALRLPTAPDQETPLPDVVSVASVGSTEVSLTGALTVDLATTGALEVRARMILPGSSVFDDPRRGRSEAQRRAGIWPKQRDLNGQILVNSQGDTRYVTAEALYGFQLAPDGAVNHRQVEVTLLKAENLPLTWPDGEPLTLLDLFEEQRLGAIRITHRHKFVDGKARVMSVWLNAISRTAPMLSTVDRVASANDPWLERRSSMVGITRDQLRAEPVPATALTNFSEPIDVVLPATQRPAACDARGPLHAFEWGGAHIGSSRLWQRRRGRIRIPLGRSWFSSGEGEKVGIVLWPPETQQRSRRSENIVSLPDTEDPTQSRRIDVGRASPEIAAFEDRDLGPGGAYVSRRGSDPVRGGTTPETKTFLDVTDFVGVDYPGGPTLLPEEVEATWVPNVKMPIQSEAPDGQDAADPSAAVPPLSVGLVLYEPRFDPVHEEWFIDIAVRPSKTAEPFLRLGLVRYQPNTVPDLRCSPPVEQWVQPLPDRWVLARRTGSGHYQIQVWGQAPQKRAHLTAGAPDAAPRVRATLFDETEDASKHIRRRWISNEPIVAEAKPRRQARSDMLWTFTFDLSEEEVRGNLMVFLEEIERFPAASFDQEPLTEAVYEMNVEPGQERTEDGRARQIKPAHRRDAGARFTATINLSALGVPASVDTEDA